MIPLAIPTNAQSRAGTLPSLVFRLSKDGAGGAEAFHRMCDGMGKTVGPSSGAPTLHVAGFHCSCLRLSSFRTREAMCSEA